MMRSTILLAASLPSISAWATAPAAFSAPSAASRLPRPRASRVPSSSALRMALDYNDPVVGEELATIQPMTYEEVEEELMSKGIPPPPMMNEMDLKLMLVEVRLMFDGRLDSKTQEVKPKPTSFSSKFEEYLYTKPVFKEFYDQLKVAGDHNAMNVVSEYINTPDQARRRYKDYESTFAQVDRALKAAAAVKTPKVSFTGFPANMGEAGCRMTLEALGAIAEFECEECEDFPVLKGTVTFEEIETAKAAIKQYNGMDMGMGSNLELVSV